MGTGTDGAVSAAIKAAAASGAARAAGKHHTCFYPQAPKDALN